MSMIWSADKPLSAVRSWRSVSEIRIGSMLELIYDSCLIYWDADTKSRDSLA